MVSFEPTPLYWGPSLIAVCILVFYEKPDATQRCPRKPEVQDFTIYTASAGQFYNMG